MGLADGLQLKRWGMQVQVLLTYWEHKYLQLQNDSAEARVESAGPKELLSFEVDMNRLAILTEDVLSENAQEHVKFLSVHCTPLKQVASCCPSGPPQGGSAEGCGLHRRGTTRYCQLWPCRAYGQMWPQLPRRCPVSWPGACGAAAL